MRYYISDLHFFHRNLLTAMDKRGFSSVEEMNEYMIIRWNSRVKKRDEVVILGDFSMGKADETEEILKRLNGRKYLVVGNHDKYLQDKDVDQSLFVWAKDYAELNDNKRKIILSHYPILCYNGQYRRNENKVPTTYMLYGHVHNTYDEVLVNEFMTITKSCFHEGHPEEGPIPCQMINCLYVQRLCAAYLRRMVGS